MECSSEEEEEGRGRLRVVSGVSGEGGGGRRWGVGRMESEGDAIVELVATVLKSNRLVGKFFTECLTFIAAVLCRDVGYQTGVASVQAEMKTQTPLKRLSSTSPLTSSTSSALLDIERGSNRPEVFHLSLALYLTASLSERWTSEVLEQADVSRLLDTLSVVVECHAHLVTKKKCKSSSLEDLLTIQSDLDHMLGGPISLSITLGYLSALLSGQVHLITGSRQVHI